MQALKYEKNPSRKKILANRIDGYMKRAEQLSDYLKKKEEQDNAATSSPKPVASATGGGDGKDEVVIILKNKVTLFFFLFRFLKLTGCTN